jgi:hypothetical protein
MYMKPTLFLGGSFLFSQASTLSSQCLDRRISDKQTLIDEIAAWEHDRNANHTKQLAPLIASFDLTTQGDNYIEHTFDLVYVSSTAPPTCWAAMILEPGSGLDYVRFSSLTLGPADPVLQQ